MRSSDVTQLFAIVGEGAEVTITAEALAHVLPYVPPSPWQTLPDQRQMAIR